LHHDNLERASMSFKDYLEQVYGGIPRNLLSKWEPQHMDLIYTTALRSHLAGTELGEAIEQGITEGPRHRRRTAAALAVSNLRQGIAHHLFPGRCAYCP
jgi:hypothetical protein